MKNENKYVSCCGLDILPNPPTARPYDHMHLVETGSKREIRASVRLTEQAHLLLVNMAKRNKVSMKTVGSEAIHTLNSAPKVEKMYRERIEELKFKALKSRQLAAFYALLAGVSMGLLGFIIGLAVK